MEIDQGAKVAFHLLAGEMRYLAYSHQRAIDDLLFQLGWETLTGFGLRDKALKGRLGATAVRGVTIISSGELP